MGNDKEMTENETFIKNLILVLKSELDEQFPHDYFMPEPMMIDRAMDIINKKLHHIQNEIATAHLSKQGVK